MPAEAGLTKTCKDTSLRREKLNQAPPVNAKNANNDAANTPPQCQHNARQQMPHKIGASPYHEARPFRLENPFRWGNSVFSPSGLRQSLRLVAKSW